jgi:hypothetical protein
MNMHLKEVQGTGRPTLSVKHEMKVWKVEADAGMKTGERRYYRESDVRLKQHIQNRYQPEAASLEHNIETSPR